MVNSLAVAFWAAVGVAAAGGSTVVEASLSSVTGVGTSSSAVIGMGSSVHVSDDDGGNCAKIEVFVMAKSRLKNVAFIGGSMCYFESVGQWEADNAKTDRATAAKQPGGRKSQW
jgi:hypothetical protein